MKAEEFEQEWKRYCDSKGGGAVTISIKDVAKHFAQWQKEQMLKELKKIEQEPTWSEEDEEMIEDLIEAIDTQYAVTDYNEMVDWLKKLKDRLI